MVENILCFCIKRKDKRYRYENELGLKKIFLFFKEGYKYEDELGLKKIATVP